MKNLQHSTLQDRATLGLSRLLARGAQRRDQGMTTAEYAVSGLYAWVRRNRWNRRSDCKGGRGVARRWRRFGVPAVRQCSPSDVWSGGTSGVRRALGTGQAEGSGRVGNICVTTARRVVSTRAALGRGQPSFTFCRFDPTLLGSPRRAKPRTPRGTSACVARPTRSVNPPVKRMTKRFRCEWLCLVVPPSTCRPTHGVLDLRSLAWPVTERGGAAQCGIIDRYWSSSQGRVALAFPHMAPEPRRAQRSD